LLLFKTKHFSVFQVTEANQSSAVDIFESHLLYSLQLILLNEFLASFVESNCSGIYLVKVRKNGD